MRKLRILLIFLLFTAGSIAAVGAVLTAASRTGTGTYADGTSLSGLFEPVSETGNLYLYTGGALDGMNYPDIFISGSDILFYDTDYSESEDNYVSFYLFDPSSCEITAENKLECEFLTDIGLTPSGIMYCDSSIGYAVLLDDTLSVTKEWSIEPNYEYWYLGADGGTLYKIDENVLSLIDLDSGDSKALLSSTVSLYGGAPLNGGADITYIDEAQMTVEAWLDFETGELTAQPFDEAVSFVSVNDGAWLATPCDSYSDYILGNESAAYYIEADGGDLSWGVNSGYLLLINDDYTLALYEPDGSFVSSCRIEGDTVWFYSDDCAYSEACGGFFIIAYSDDGPLLYFWDTGTAAEGEDLEMIPSEDYGASAGGSSADPTLYERAASIGDQYGVEILIADQCADEYDDFTVENISDYDLIREGLDTLESALSRYPDGFFDQIKYDKINAIQFHLTGSLTPSNSNRGDENYNGFTEEHSSALCIVLDLNQLYEDTVFHEVSHAIDGKLEWDAFCTDDALFSEETWASFNPDGFEYTYEYAGFEGLEFEGDEYLCFIDTYSMISPTEDRARIMEYAMAGYDSFFTEFEPVKDKLAYYCECIRDAFDTKGWPEVTCWEEPLS